MGDEGQAATVVTKTTSKKGGGMSCHTSQPPPTDLTAPWHEDITPGGVIFFDVIGPDRAMQLREHFDRYAPTVKMGIRKSGVAFVCARHSQSRRTRHANRLTPTNPW